MTGPVGFAVNNGPTQRSLPGFCRDCRHDAPDGVSRCPACGSPRLLRHRRARRACHRPRGLRRVLCHHREARRSDARRQTGDRRRPPARRRAHGLLRGTHLRRAIGDADVRGAAAVPACQRGAAGHGEIRRCRTRGARTHVRAHAAGRAGLDRRGLHGSVRHRAPARNVARQVARRLRRRRRAEPRDHGVDRALLQQVPRQDRLRSRQAARLCRARRRRGGRVPGAEAGHPDLRCRQDGAATARARRLAHHRRSPARRRDAN